MVEQEGRLAVQGTAADRMHQAAEQAGRERRLEEHGKFARFDASTAQTGHRTLGGNAPDAGGIVKLAGAAPRRVPVVALHGILLAGDHRARDVVARSRIAAHEAEAVGRDEMRLLRRHRSAFGIADQRADLEGRLLATARRLDGILNGQRPRMIQIQIGNILGQQRRVGQAGTVVRGREAGDVERRLDRLAQGLRREVGSAGVALALAGIDGNADALVAVEFDGLDLVATHPDRLAETFGNIDFAGGRALVAGMFEHILSQLLQGRKGIGKAGDFRHERGVRTGKSLS